FLPEFLLARNVSPVEKYDMTMLMSSYAMMPLLAVNIYVSTYICGFMWKEQLRMLPPVIPYLFILMSLLTVAVILSTGQSIRHGIRYWFLSHAIYQSLLPVLAWSFIAHLFRRPAFVRTPKH